MRGALPGRSTPAAEVEWSRACFEAYWGRGPRHLEGRGHRRSVAKQTRDWIRPSILDPESAEPGDQGPSPQRTTQELIDRGGFGSPTIFVNGEDMFFGNDRLPLVEAALARV